MPLATGLRLLLVPSVSKLVCLLGYRLETFARTGQAELESIEDLGV